MRIELAPSHWDERFFQLCATVASWSEDQSRKVGAVIVGPSNEVRALGYNGFPRGISGEAEIRHSRADGEKYHWFEHAERNAIYNSARTGVSVLGCRLYVNLFPCADCARGIIQSGITRVNTYKRPENDDSFDRSFDISSLMLEEAGVDVVIFAETQGTPSKGE